MDFALIIIAGLLSGFLYAESIYARSKRGKNPLTTFPIRFFLTALIMFLIEERFGVKGLTIFVISHTAAMLIFTCYKTFSKP